MTDTLPMPVDVRLMNVTTALLVTGLVLASPFLASYPFEARGAVLVGATALAGVLLTLAAAAACRPLQSHVLDSAGRGHD